MGIVIQLSFPEKAMSEQQDWYFTFGQGQEHHNRYVKIHGTAMEARKEMFRRFGEKWSMMYSEEQFRGQPEEYGLTELK